MRPGQKNRMRGGRGNNNNNGSRRGPNPLTRSYESNGPDVKVRGTPQHIAEKYVQLARDAHSASDTVMAESYLQHAEHYYRIIAAAQNAQQHAYNQANGIANTEQEQVEDEDEFEVAGMDRFTFRAPQSFQQQGGFNSQSNQGFNNDPASSDQPPIGDGQPSMMEGTSQGFPQQQPRGERQPYGNRRFEERGDRQDRSQQDRPPQDRSQQDRPQQEGRYAEGRQQDGRGDRRFGRDRANRSFGGERTFGGDRQVGETRPLNEGRQQGERSFADRGGERPAFQPRPDAAPQPVVAEEQTGLPSFITAPVRIIPVMEPAAVPDAPGDAAVADTGIRPRRRRRKAPGEGDVAAEVGEE